MPELPDVEVFRRYLDATALHTAIAGVHAERLGDLGGLSRQRLVAALSGRPIEQTGRHGKFLFAGLGDGGWLVLHFGMTGSLAYYKNASAEPDHLRLLLDLADGYHLAYRCQRLLGRIDLTDDPAEFVRRADMGPDALAIGKDAFTAMLGNRRGVLKGALMDQSAVAGIGNVYADEILFQARVHPERVASDLDEDARARVFRVMRRVLRTAIDRKADVDAYPRSWITPRRDGEGDCPRCGGPIERTTVVGRTTVVCPACQS